MSQEDRLKVLESLRQGWLDGNRGEEIPSHLIQYVKDHLLEIEGFPEAFIDPLPEGGILLEWDFKETPEGGWIELDLTLEEGDIEDSGGGGDEAKILSDVSIYNAVALRGQIERLMDLLPAH